MRGGVKSVGETCRTRQVERFLPGYSCASTADGMGRRHPLLWSEAGWQTRPIWGVVLKAGRRN
jgi:hypothetical protein